MAMSAWAPVFRLEEAPPAPAGVDSLATGLEFRRLGSMITFETLPPCPYGLGLPIKFPWDLSFAEWTGHRLRLRHETCPDRLAGLEWLQGGVRLSCRDEEGCIRKRTGAYHHIVLRGMLAGRIDQNQAYLQAGDLFYRDYSLSIADTGPLVAACHRYLAELGPEAEVLHFTSAPYAHLRTVLDAKRRRAATITHHGRVKLLEHPRMDALLKAVEAGAVPCRLPQPLANADPMEPVEPAL